MGKAEHNRNYRTGDVRFRPGIPLLLPVICWSLCVVATAPPPRCKAEGYYQASLLIFSCDGSGGYSLDNQVQTLIPPRASWTQTVPQATRNLIVTVDSPTGISLSLMDPLTLTAIQGPKYKGVPFIVSGASGAQLHRELRLSGTSPNDLVLQVTNLAGVPAVVKVGYVYAFYTSPLVSKQCQQGSQPLGCGNYDQLLVRNTVADWSCWLRTKYNSSDAAWNSLALPSVQGLGVPAYSWCDIWQKWQAAPLNVHCMAAYKFITQGGKELGIQKVYRPSFNWALKACALRKFLASCCKQLRSQWSNVQSAWGDWITGSQTLDPAILGPWEACQANRPSGIFKEDFLKFLDSDGYGGVRLTDIAVCWSSDAYRVSAPVAPGSDMPALPAFRPSTAKPSPVPLDLGRTAKPKPKPKRKLPVTTTLPARTLPPLKPGQLRTSIMTGVAAGIAASAATATAITLQMQTAQQSKGQQRPPRPKPKSKLRSTVPPKSVAQRIVNVNTSLTKSAQKGATILSVVSSSGFKVGRKVLLDVGTMLQEANVIANLSRRLQSVAGGSVNLILQRPLNYTHASGVIVTMPKASRTTDSMRTSLPSWQQSLPVLALVLALLCLCALLGAVMMLCCRSGKKTRAKSMYGEEGEDVDYEDPDECETDHEQAPLLSERPYKPQRISPVEIVQPPPKPRVVQVVEEYQQPEKEPEVGSFSVGVPSMFGPPPAYTKCGQLMYEH